MDNLLSHGGFQVKGWLSNQPLRKEKEGQRETSVKLLQGATEEEIFGTIWNHAEDVFMFKFNPPEEIKLTKRGILSQIARLLDPVGFAAAFLVRAKIGMQRLWQIGLEWDQELPTLVREE